MKPEKTNTDAAIEMLKNAFFAGWPLVEGGFVVATDVAIASKYEGETSLFKGKLSSKDCFWFNLASPEPASSK